MILINFKNLEKSDLAKIAVEERLGLLINKFPDLRASRIQVTLEMENSPTQPGPDLFKVKLHVGSGRYKGITFEKGDPNLYVALAELSDHMLERLNRFGDKLRVKQRSMARRVRRRTQFIKGESVESER